MRPCLKKHKRGLERWLGLLYENAIFVYVVYEHVCVHTHTHMLTEVKEVMGCPALSFSALFFGDSLDLDLG